MDLQGEAEDVDLQEVLVATSFLKTQASCSWGKVGELEGLLRREAHPC